jgi:hypothetical protein
MDIYVVRLRAAGRLSRRAAGTYVRIGVRRIAVIDEPAAGGLKVMEERAGMAAKPACAAPF